jgi:uncharacterized membrane protein YdbT with pleckstrin-like domain
MGHMTDDNDLSDGERTVLTLHPHWKTVLRPALILAAVAVVASVALILIPAGSYSAAARGGVALVAVIVAVIWTLVPLLRWRTTTYQLTTRRLRLRYGILSRTGRDFPLLRISDVSFSHGIIDRLLGCGKLVVESASEHGQLVLTEIPHVEKVQATLFQLVEDEQARLARDDR